MDWQRLDQIIRLWRATGWSLDDLDLALVALQPAPYGDVDVDVVGGIARITELGTAGLKAGHYCQCLHRV